MLQLNAGNQADTWIQIADSQDLQFGSNDFSVCYWAKKFHASGNYSDTYGVGKWRSGAYPGAHEWTLTLSTGSSPLGDDRPAFGFESAAGFVNYGISSPTNLSLATWHFLVGVRRSDSLELYVDGVLAARSTLPTGTAVNNVAGGRDLYIGASAQGQGFGANALYDEVQVYNHALTSGGVSVGQTAGEEIAFLYAHPGSEIPPPTAKHLLIADEEHGAILRFDEASGAALGAFASTSALTSLGLAYGPDGNLYVADWQTSHVYN